MSDRMPRAAKRSLFVGGMFALHLATGYAQAQSTASTLQEVVVTGSRIKRVDTFESPVPIAVMDAKAIADGGSTMLGDALAALPQALMNVNVQSTSTSLFNAGQSRIDLRGLSGSRTLVLVDGRRHLTGDFRNSIVDLNTIPSMMIERVEVISGGASAVYGSEAIAGVVNVILRKKLDGAIVDVQGGISAEGDGNEWKSAIAFGSPFAAGRGSFLIGAELGSVDPILQTDRAWAYPGIRRDTTITPQPIIPASRTNLSPGATFQLISTTTATARSVTIPTDRSAVYTNSPACRTSTVQPTCQDPWLIYTAQYNVLQGDVNRFSLRGYLDFELTDTLKVFADVSYAEIGGIGQTTPVFSNAGGGGTMPVVIRGDNAYLNGASPLAAQLRTAWTGAGLTLVRGSTVNVGKIWEEFGNRNADVQRKTYQLTSGLDGKFDLLDRNVEWDFYAQYSELTGVTIQYAVPYIARVQQAVDAVSVGGQIVCADAAAQAAGCIPWDLINGPSQAAVDWANASARSDGLASQTVVAANASTSLFELPAGPLQLAAGAEYREEKSDHIQDPISASNQLFYNQIGRTKGEYNIVEGYLEVEAPLLRDLPGAHRLSVGAAGRYGDYSTVGGVSQWRLQTTWAPIEDLSFRASKSIAVRAPNIIELYAPNFRNFIAGALDPCDRTQVAAIASDPAKQALRIANCTAVIPGYSSNPTTGFQSNVGPGRPTLPVIQGGSTTLFEETADTITAGFVVRPRALPDFQMSFDYWKIDIDDAISTIPVNTIMANLCYDVAMAPSSNRYCQFVRRDATGATTGGLVGGIIEVVTTNQNVQAIETSGYDLALQYGHTFGDVGTFQIRIDATKFARWDLLGVPGGPTTHYVGTITGPNGAVPDYKANGTLNWSRRHWSLQWQTRFLNSMAVSEVDPPSSRDPFYTGNYFEHDLRGSFQVTDTFTVRAGIINVTDEHPPLLPEVGNAIGQGTSAYDNRGRFYYAGVNLKFGKER